MESVRCPLCDGEVRVPVGATVGDLVSCIDCGAEFEVASKDPLALEEAP
ncbi:hypothetical protein FACS1894204_07810 [Synergistales bacterium]|nr:hypothetical protein FACS1894204_07810 [Synergistales bacterium]